MSGSRKALLIATDSYSDPTFRQLRAPGADVTGLHGVLSDPAIGDYEVGQLLNSGQPQVTRLIEGFFVDAARDDLLLLYISGHGVKDDDGRLFLPMQDSRHDRLDSTAVSAEFLNRQLLRSRARSIVVVLDCCYSGAFPAGLRHRAGDRVDILTQLGGRGRAVMTSSSALEYSYEVESGAVEKEISAEPSLFTGMIIDGLRTGDADLDGDGWIDIDELYSYVYDRVRAASTAQTPQRKFDLDGRLLIAASSRGPRAKSGIRQQEQTEADDIAVASPSIGREVEDPPAVEPEAVKPSAAARFIRAAGILLLVLLIAFAAQTIYLAFNEYFPDSAAFSSDGKYIAVGEDSSGRTVIWSAKTDDVSGILNDPGSKGVNSVAWVPSAYQGTSDVLAVGDNNGKIYLWKVSSDKILAALADPNSAGVDSVEWSPNGRDISVVDGDGAGYIWSIAKNGIAGTLVATLAPPDLSATSGGQGPETQIDSVDSISWEPNGQMIATGDESGNIYLWSASDYKMVDDLTDPDTSDVESIDWTSAGPEIAAGDASNNIYLWNVTTHRVVAQLTSRLDDGTVNDVTYAPDGDTLAVSESGGGIVLWNMITDKLIGQIGNTESPSLSYSANGSLLVSVNNWRDCVYLWNTTSHQETTALIDPASFGTELEYATRFWHDLHL